MQLAPAALGPAYVFVREHGNLLTQLGASTVEATDSTTVTATFTNNFRAVNVDALLKDSVRGAKLVIDNQSLTRDLPQPSAHGIASALEGIERAEVYSIEGTPHEIAVVSFDRSVVTGLQAMVDTSPIPGVTVSIPDEPA